MSGPEQHAATLRGMAAYVPVEDHYGTHPRQAYDAALDELVALARDRNGGTLVQRWRERAEAAEAALRLVAAQPHAPADGAGTDGAVHLYAQGHPMGCPICQAIETGLA